jgi:hypothetical protein
VNGDLTALKVEIGVIAPRLHVVPSAEIVPSVSTSALGIAPGLSVALTPPGQRRAKDRDRSVPALIAPDSMARGAVVAAPSVVQVGPRAKGVLVAVLVHGPLFRSDVLIAVHCAASAIRPRPAVL